jgi:four helix bundle protein
MEKKSYKFENLEVWKISLELTDVIYEIIIRLPKEEDFNLKSQMRRAVTSISLNIAEGSIYFSNKEQISFLRIALHSTIEIIASLKLLERKKFLKANDPLLTKGYEISNLEFAKLNAFLKSLK